MLAPLFSRATGRRRRSSSVAPSTPSPRASSSTRSSRTRVRPASSDPPRRHSRARQCAPACAPLAPSAPPPRPPPHRRAPRGTTVRRAALWRAHAQRAAIRRPPTCKRPARAPRVQLDPSAPPAPPHPPPAPRASTRRLALARALHARQAPIRAAPAPQRASRARLDLSASRAPQQTCYALRAPTVPPPAALLRRHVPLARRARSARLALPAQQLAWPARSQPPPDRAFVPRVRWAAIARRAAAQRARRALQAAIASPAPSIPPRAAPARTLRARARGRVLIVRLARIKVRAAQPRALPARPATFVPLELARRRLALLVAIVVRVAARLKARAPPVRRAPLAQLAPPPIWFVRREPLPRRLVHRRAQSVLQAPSKPTPAKLLVQIVLQAVRDRRSNSGPQHRMPSRCSHPAFDLTLEQTTAPPARQHHCRAQAARIVTRR